MLRFSYILLGAGLMSIKADSRIVLPPAAILEAAPKPVSLTDGTYAASARARRQMLFEEELNSVKAVDSVPQALLDSMQKTVDTMLVKERGAAFERTPCRQYIVAHNALDRFLGRSNRAGGEDEGGDVWREFVANASMLVNHQTRFPTCRVGEDAVNYDEVKRWSIFLAR